jgi:hypothetical protein
MGRPVQLDSVPLEGVPRTGVVSVGLVRVLFVRVSEPAKVASVPVVGSVRAVLAVAVNDWVNAPACVTLPATVMVFAPLFTPVPPDVPAIGVLAVTVVKAPVDAVVAPIAPWNPVLVIEVVATPPILNAWELASKMDGRNVVCALSKNTSAVPVPDACPAIPMRSPPVS